MVEQLTEKEYLTELGYDDCGIVAWPESQELMEKDWFNECILINDDTGLDLYGSSAYIVPDEYLKLL